MPEITVTEFVRDEGTIVVFRGVNEDGKDVTFAADHRPAGAILQALQAAAAEHPEIRESVVAEVEDYLVLSVQEPVCHLCQHRHAPGLGYCEECKECR